MGQCRLHPLSYWCYNMCCSALFSQNLNDFCFQVKMTGKELKLADAAKAPIAQA